MWYILLVGLLAQASGTQVTYHTTSQAQSSASSSSSETKNWSWQEPSASASGQQDDYHPLSFTASDVVDPNQGKQQSPNVQSDSSSVAQVLDQFTQQTVDTVVDDILDSSRRGRNLEGYDELYADPDVKNALQIGNDTIARAYIRDKLCSLGLMNCENNEGRRPFYSPHRDIHPHDIIYAQPVTIKPVGRPLPAIPIKRPYGPAKPVPLPPGIGSGPIYSGPPGPIYSGAPGHFPGPSSSFSGAHHSFPGPYPGYKKPSFGHGTRPVYEAGFDGEYDFEDKFLEKKQVLVQQPTAAGVQQHVHHHYHHGEGDVKNPAVIVGTPGLAGPIVNPGVVSSNGLNSYGYGSSGTYGSGYNDFEDYKKAFKVKTPSNGNSLDPLTSSPSYANRYPTYDKSKRDSIFTSKGFSGGVESTKILSSGFGGGNSFVNQGFGSGNSGFGQGSSSGFIANGGHPSNHGFGTNAGLGSSNGFENYPSNNYEDCLCVPYDQCAGIDHAGRKDDLFLAIDPRNLGKDIEAVEEVVVTDGNGTMSTIRVPKEVNGTEQAENAKEQAAKAADVQTKAPDSTQRSKRDAKQVADTKDKNADVQSRLIVGDVDTSKLNFKPTWGVSFGLPQNAGGNYPVNPYGDNSLVNPYQGYGAGGGQGLNLGLVSVNPLLAVQVTKDDYGEKVIKPFVNLHVTPNQGFVNKLGNILAHKKELLLGGQPGGYYGPHFGGSYPSGHYAPNYYPSGPSSHGRPIFVENPNHYYPTGPQSPSWSGYERPQQHYHNHHHTHQHNARPDHGHYYNQNNHYGGHPGYYRDSDDYDDPSSNYDFSDYGDGYFRNARTNVSASPRVPRLQNSAIQNTRSEGQRSEEAGGTVAFRDRKKRDVLDQVGKIRERVRTVLINETPEFPVHRMKMRIIATEFIIENPRRTNERNKTNEESHSSDNINFSSIPTIN
ncbi:uncharacterized protein [Venturia canescens]|uniref:uncharacterized protein isoform X1 n=1 Tax=Venturia canescens TaxID=32260 RepID=UPI001C9BCC66|nr:uncharacterized protein LOC122414663 isoform X1 [Venturia canescens]XP_043282096.1 uncharacterized protein LOC122414663 isoform X1 [Venturia canescens]